jgi:hypothetical protein
MSGTPRTDYYTKRLRSFCDDEYVPIEFARQLERELAAMTEQRDRLAKALWSMLNQDDMSAIRAGILLRSLGLQSPTNPNEL